MKLRAEEHVRMGQRNRAYIDSGMPDVVDDCALIDLVYQGNFWTFEKKKVTDGTFTRDQMDRVLGSAEWSAQSPLTSLTHLTTTTSDHTPTCLNLTGGENMSMNQRQIR